eukprot:TRINITY_DN7925_c0_g1_i1.p1 TRINITY_DN7925_c0_g1~~TRINITY_DN7925_c0_g1_i1.p1  ORF type:complete len:464 (+),score=98.15 TRINITY_DN7925_c0_g1_i1:246-1637(+)
MANMEDKQYLISPSVAKTDANYGSVESETKPDKPQGVSNTLKLLFFICGLSAFARSESVLMQTQMYAQCFDLGPNFYAAASSAIFMPGIFIQIIQTKYDRYFDRTYGTYRAAAYRIVLAFAASLIALMALVIVAKHDDSLRDNPAFVYILLAIMGLGISVSFGCFTQITSMFPPELHPFFFFGTYAPFFIFAPVNVAIGDLCEKVHMPSTSGGNDMDYTWETRWDSATVYYIVAVSISLAGMICFFGIAKHPVGKVLFAKKDSELHAERSAGASPSINHDAPLLSTQANAVAMEQSMTVLTCFKSVWIEVVAQSITTICSTLIAAMYIDIPASHFEDLPTILLYDYYIFGSAGIVITSWKPFRSLLSPKILLIMAVVRIAFVPLSIACTQGTFGRNDYIVVALNSVQMAVAGMIFSLSFSFAADKFTTKPARTLASTIMNVFYYIAMAIAMGSSFGLKHNDDN